MKNYSSSVTQPFVAALERKGLAIKYKHAGVYSISIDGHLVYIGKSTDMLVRIAFHLQHIQLNTEPSHKYDILREARERGLPIAFNVMYLAKETTQDCQKEELGKIEAQLIHQYRPVLNVQIPDINNYKKYTVNKLAQTVTLDEIILGETLEGYIF